MACSATHTGSHLPPAFTGRSSSSISGLSGWSGRLGRSMSSPSPPPTSSPSTSPPNTPRLHRRIQHVGVLHLEINAESHHCSREKGLVYNHLASRTAVLLIRFGSLQLTSNTTHPWSRHHILLCKPTSSGQSIPLCILYILSCIPVCQVMCELLLITIQLSRVGCHSFLYKCICVHRAMSSLSSPPSTSLPCSPVIVGMEPLLHLSLVDGCIVWSIKWGVGPRGEHGNIL